ncbi:D-Ala-D-Ala carboxypeptidase family metallohydrolase [Xylanibacter ruminicola]
MKRLCVWLEELRKRYNEKYGVGEEPIHINSGYRSPQLNKKVGGVAGSNHLTGCAVDIRVLGTEQLIRYANILLDYADESHQDFDELLIEKNRYGAIWLHFAVRPFSNRRKVNFINA